MTRVLSDLPWEILTDIFASVIERPFHPTSFHNSRLRAIQDLLRLTHINSRMRFIAIHEPRLWTMMAFLNIHEDLFETILIRSTSLPFCLSFTEDATLPSDEDTKSWMLAFDHSRRLGFLSIEVAEGFTGTRTKATLKKQLPALQQCIVWFHGERVVQLDSRAKPLFNGRAPLLKSLDLTNCFASLGRRCIPRINCMAIRCLPQTVGAISLFLDNMHLWQPQFQLLRSLVIFSTADMVIPLEDIKLPFLENLVVVAPIRLCGTLARSLSFPPECSCSVTVLFPESAGLQHAKLGALAALAFLQDDGFQECIFDINGEIPSIRLVRRSRRNVLLRFRLLQVSMSQGLALKLFCRALNCLVLPCSVYAPLDTQCVFLFQLWDTLADSLSNRLKNVSRLRMATPPNKSSEVIYVLPLISKMQRLSVLMIDSSAILAADSFLHLSLLTNAFADLNKLVVRLRDRSWDDNMKAGLSTFLRSRLERGSPIQELLFVVSPQLMQTFGYASVDEIRLLVSDIVEGAPQSISVDWVEN